MGLMGCDQRGQCIMFSVVFTPPPPGHHTTAMFGSYLASLYT
jgi:hypothetical protein